MKDDLELEFKTTSKLKEGKDCELLTFSLPIFGGLEIVCIVAIPDQTSNSAPVYIKIRKARHQK